VDLLAGKIDRLDAADFLAGDADRRSDRESRDVGKSRLQRIALPEEPARARQGEDENRGDDDRDNRHHADLEFRPGQRPCSWHRQSYDRNFRMYGSVDDRSASASPSKQISPSFNMMNSACFSFAGVAGTTCTA